MNAENGTADSTLAGLIDRQIIYVTGKGGVGKTTVAAALARLAVKAGKRVLVGELGSKAGAPSALRHVLTGSNAPLSEEPTELVPGLEAVVLTPESGHRAFLRDVLPLGFLADRALRIEPLKRFLNAAPAFAELGILYRGMELAREEKRGRRRYDVVILDSPATGHALAFATLPEVMLKIIPGGPIGRAMREGHQMLTDPKRTAVVVTTLPEALPVSEALELVAGLEKSKILVRGVVVNLVPDDPFTAGEHAALDVLLASGKDAGGVLGERSLGRLRRARAALDRLRAHVGETLLMVREDAARGPELVRHVASELGPA